MTRYEVEAAIAVRQELESTYQSVPLRELECVADQAARVAGKSVALYDRAERYAVLLPEGWRARYRTCGTLRVLYAEPPVREMVATGGGRSE